MYVTMALATPTFYTTEQLTKIDRQFAHPSAEKLYQLLRRARTEDTTMETLAVIEVISKM